MRWFTHLVLGLGDGIGRDLILNRELPAAVGHTRKGSERSRKGSEEAVKSEEAANRRRKRVELAPEVRAVSAHPDKKRLLCGLPVRNRNLQPLDRNVADGLVEEERVWLEIAQAVVRVLRTAASVLLAVAVRAFGFVCAVDLATVHVRPANLHRISAFSPMSRLEIGQSACTKTASGARDGHQGEPSGASVDQERGWS